MPIMPADSTCAHVVVLEDVKGIVLMPFEDFGTEQTTDEDRAYNGSRFSEVRDALFTNSYQRVWGQEGEPALPLSEVTLGSVLHGILPFGTPYLFRQATERTVDSDADLRWGHDGKGFRRLFASERHMPDRTVADHGTNPILGLFRKGQRGAGDRSILDVLHKNPPRPTEIDPQG
jgi:hypothetical protein